MDISIDNKVNYLTDENKYIALISILGGSHMVQTYRLGHQKNMGEKKNFFCCICTMRLFLSQINNLPLYNEVRHRQMFCLIEDLVCAQKTFDIKPTVYITQMNFPSFCFFHKEPQDTGQKGCLEIVQSSTYSGQVKQLAAWAAVEQLQSRKGLSFAQVEFIVLVCAHCLLPCCWHH